MLTTNFQGRTGNILLQNVGLSVLSKKFDIKASYAHIEKSDLLGLRLNEGTRIFKDCILLEDEHKNLPELLKKETLDHGIIYSGGFQVKYFVQNFRKEILDNFCLKYDNRRKEDFFIHVRLGDATHSNPGYDYYEKCILSITNLGEGYIATDSLQHPIVQNLITKFNLHYIDGHPIELIEFAKNFNNLILSKGTFSWWMGVLSKAENIFYAVGDPAWYGPIYIFEEWKPVSLNL